jgi:spermidine synthase
LRQSGVPANSDYFPFVDQNAARARILKRSAIELNQLHLLPVPLFDLLEGKADTRAQTLLPGGPVTWREQSLRTALTWKSALMASRYEVLNAAQARLLLSLNSPAKECAEPAVRRAWLSSAAVIASLTTPQLSASELAPMWDRIEATPCAAALDTQDRQFAHLLRAIATRSVARTSAIGTELLENGYRFAEPSQFQMALLATAASHISAGQPERALLLLQRNAGKTSSTPAVALAMRWMSSIGAESGRQTLTRNSPR